ncbi:nucleotidyl transferase AbiEii/AbiGii toxin family protein [Bradyrhizobium campsiandrae]|uniref:nucleotidyl transferase AbiEii/AbiGii toxin family protein n=1 Tax=Bradyrhizobium campsiandrae TaxID=1729892 RepID=UPI001FCE4446|nr:nucleotidyl transferase AbiEii/AbiGii toxin family protein [Bradyrhizobium campsiandrae]
MKVASFADLYAGKLVAALDRQHPRDLFDVRDLPRQRRHHRRSPQGVHRLPHQP